MRDSVSRMGCSSRCRLSGTLNARSVRHPLTDRAANGVGDTVVDSVDAIADAFTDIAVNL